MVMPPLAKAESVSVFLRVFETQLHAVRMKLAGRFQVLQLCLDQVE